MAEFKLDSSVEIRSSNNKKIYEKDKKILDICKILTEKGYVTKSSCEGHLNEIGFYIDENTKMLCIEFYGFVMFNKNYGISSMKLPKYWKYKEVNGKDGMYTTIHKSDPLFIIPIRKATDDEISKYGTMKYGEGHANKKNIKEIHDIDKITNKLDSFKNAYLNSLRSWANSLPDINKKDSLNEATQIKRLTGNAAKRKEITDFIVEMYNALEKGGTKNSDNFLAKTQKMSDSQFIAYMTSIVNDPKKHLYFEIEAFENEPDYETVENVANNIVGEEYTHLYDYIAFPHLSEDPKKPIYTVHKVFNGYINMRRVQQLVNNKNHIPTSSSRRDPKTNQVVFESKAARVADVEMFALICHGTKNVLKEFFGPRGGDPVMRDEMSQQIATTGTAQLSEMHDSKLNKTSLNTANVYLVASAIESDLVTKNGILPRTIMNQYKEARTLDRTNVR